MAGGGAGGGGGGGGETGVCFQHHPTLCAHHLTPTTHPRSQAARTLAARAPGRADGQRRAGLQESALLPGRRRHLEHERRLLRAGDGEVGRLLRGGAGDAGGAVEDDARGALAAGALGERAGVGGDEGQAGAGKAEGDRKLGAGAGGGDGLAARGEGEAGGAVLGFGLWFFGWWVELIRGGLFMTRGER